MQDEFMDSLEQVMLLAFLPGIKDGKLPGNAPKVLNKFWDKEHRTAVHQRVLDSILSAECGRTGACHILAALFCVVRIEVIIKHQSRTIAKCNGLYLLTV